MTTFDLMFTTEEDMLLSMILNPNVCVTGTTHRYCVERPSGWRELCCWNWGGTLTTNIPDYSSFYKSMSIGVEGVNHENNR